jgi:hypothetical protein
VGIALYLGEQLKVISTRSLALHVLGSAKIRVLEERQLLRADVSEERARFAVRSCGGVDEPKSWKNLGAAMAQAGVTCCAGSASAMQPRCGSRSPYQTKRHSRGIVKTSKLLALSARRNLAKQYHTIYLTERFRFDEKPGVTYAFAWQVISEAPTFGSSIKGSCSELTYVSNKGRGSTCDAAVWTSRRLGTWAQP